MNMSFADVMMQLFRQHLAVLPVLLPSFTAMLMLLIGDRDSLPRLRRIALVSVALGLMFALKLAMEADDGALRVYRVGD